MPSRLGTIVLLVTWIVQVICVPPVAGATPDSCGFTALIQVENWEVLIAYQVRQLALGQRCGQGQGRRRCVRRIRRRRPRLQQEVIVWHRLKPVLEEVVKGELDRTDSVSSFRLPVQIVVVTPDYDQTLCPDCGGPTKCKRSYHSHPQDINLEQPTILQVHREVRQCCDATCETCFTPELDFVAKEERFTKRAKQKAIASVTEDGMPLGRVPQRMWRDFHVRVTKSTVHRWVHEEAEADLGEVEYTQWVTERFSGVVGIDEVHLRDENGEKQYLVVAVDSINDRTILFDLVDSRDSDAIKGFLEQLKEMGIDPLVVVTDMWKAYHNAILDVFPEAEHQLCVFHVIQAMMKHTNKVMLAYRRELPKETDAHKAVRKELWDCRYLLLKASHKLSAQQRKRLEALLDSHKESVLPEAHACKEAILALFRESKDKDDARSRRDAIIERFEDTAGLEKVLNVIRGEEFEQMIVYLDYENLDKTNNDAERENRVYQKGEKIRYRARKTRTRLNYVRLRARQRNRRSAERNDHLRRRKKRRAMFVRRVDTVVEREARGLTA
jgi:transposase-like protein